MLETHAPLTGKHTGGRARAHARTRARTHKAWQFYKSIFLGGKADLRLPTPRTST